MVSKQGLKYKKIAVKIGSNVLTQPDGTLDLSRISSLVNQIAQLHKLGVELILISSGAVASGRSLLETEKRMDVVDQRQLFSAIGQAHLINHYYNFFQAHDIVVGQILTTKENFSTRRHYLNQRNCIRVMFENRVIPIVNENDAVSVSELMFTDNDELSGLIASMMDVEALIILSNVDGVYDGSPADSKSKLIREVKKGEDVSSFAQNKRSGFGRGGMQTKSSIARKIANEGIEVYIANGEKENILLALLNKNAEADFTHFVATPESVSSVKKWIAHSEGFAKGEVYINENAAKIIKGEKAVSLLPVGVVKIVGDFEKDDIIKVFDEKKNFLGVGKAQYDSLTAKQAVGQKQQKALIHYDYFFLEH